MNPKPVFKLFSPKGKAQAVVQQGISTLIISSVVLSLVVLTGYGRIVQASGPGGQPSIEMLRNIDPADRKFFSPGYGALSGEAAKVEVLLPTDPADRKFFTPGYGVNAPKNDLTAYHQSEWNRASNIDLSIEDRPTIDPADRKFFTPGYGTQGVMPGKTDALPTVDPADRKFFTPGYGTQTSNADGSEVILPTIENEMGHQVPIWFLLK